jgi:hypothetical protein
MGHEDVRMGRWSDDPPVWIRERRGEKWRPKPPEPRARYDYFLPEDWARRKAAERARNLGAFLTTAPGVTGRKVDDTVKERVVVLAEDTREQKDNQALALVDYTPGLTPTVFIGDGATYWQDMGDQIDEGRHYKLDRTPERDPADLHGRYLEEAQKAADRRAGKITGGSAARLDADGKPRYPPEHNPRRWTGHPTYTGDVRRAAIKGE